jgi:hypothetical protein
MRKLLLSLLAVVATACTDETTSLTSPPRPAEGSVAYVQLSNAHPAAGSTITVTARVNAAAGVSDVGSFTARLRFDAAGLEYVGEEQLSGGMRLLKANVSDIAAAGASAEGFGEGQLFAVTFKVIDPAAVQSIALDVSELTGVDFGAQTSRLAVDRRVFVR